MATTVPKDRTIAALEDVWTRLADMLEELPAEDWERPTCLPGWRVRDVVAHVMGTERMLAGEQPTVPIDRAQLPHVHNDIGAFNEQWVVQQRSDPPAALLARWRDLAARRLADLRSMDQGAWDREGFTPAGTDSYGRFMRIRTFDCWLHEQDVRDAVDRPGGEGGPAAELALAEMATAMGFVVGKKAGAPAGARVRFELTGPAARRIDVEVGERAAVVEELSGEPTVTLTMPAAVFARLGGGRAEPATRRSQVAIDGATDADVELGERILANLAFTI